MGVCQTYIVFVSYKMEYLWIWVKLNDDMIMFLVWDYLGSNHDILFGLGKNKDGRLKE